MIAIIDENTGVCLEGRWRGWLFQKRLNGEWVSVRKLEEVDPNEDNWIASIFKQNEDIGY